MAQPSERSSGIVIDLPLMAAATGLLLWNYWGYIQPQLMGSEGLEALVFLVFKLNSAIIVVSVLALDNLSRFFRSAMLRLVFRGGIVLSLVLIYLDLLIYQRLRIHIPDAIGRIFEMGFREAPGMLASTGLSSHRMAFGAIVLLVTVPVGGLLVTASERWLRSWHLTFSLSGFLAATLLASGSFLGFLLTWSRFYPNTYTNLAGVLPVCPAVIGQPPGLDTLGLRLRPLHSGAERESLLETISVPSNSLPDIWLITIESLRPDAITPQISPNLRTLASDALPFSDSTSAGNGTQLGWYSLFTANNPLSFRLTCQSTQNWGATPIRILKKLGYDCHVYSASDLSFYNLERVLFGTNRQLLSSLIDSRSLEEMSPSSRDEWITSAAIAEAARPSRRPRAFFLFFESTHHDYHWPDNYPVPFFPFPSKWDYHVVTPTQVSGILNRYKNAVHFVDSLVGRIIAELRSQGRYERSIVFVGGDHGEEFLEFGNMVHANSLNRSQTATPMIFKPSGRTAPALPDGAVATQMDVFPSIFWHLGIETGQLLEGRPFWTRVPPFSLSAEQKGATDPNHFFIYNGEWRVYFRYQVSNPLIDWEQQVLITRVCDADDVPISLPAGINVRTAVLERFEQGLKTLFIMGRD